MGLWILEDKVMDHVPGMRIQPPPLIPRADDAVKAPLDISISRIRKNPVEEMSPISSTIRMDRIRLFSFHSPAMIRMILWYGPDNPGGVLKANDVRRTGPYGNAI